jgi:hypothetical protein
MKLNRKLTAAEVVDVAADVAAVAGVAVVDMAVVVDVVEVVVAEEENEEADRVSRLWFYTSQSFQAINTFENAGFTDKNNL